MWRSPRFEPRTTLKAVTQFAALILLFGLAECAAAAISQEDMNEHRGSITKKINSKSSRGTSSCLSYGHSCWGAHGKRSGGGANNDFLQQALEQASPEETRWYLSKLVGPRSPSSRPRNNYKLWERFDSSAKDDVDSMSTEKESPLGRPDVLRNDEGSEPAGGAEDDQGGAVDGEEVLLMAAPEETQGNRGPQKLRLFKIMNRSTKKNDN